MEQAILARAHALEPWIIETRRLFHQHPEPSMQEFWTTDEICRTLDAFGIPYKRFKNSPGCLAFIHGAKEGKTVALRSDIDALRVQEQSDVPYKSLHDGVMHACGHDAHITMNLAAARILNEMKDQLAGTVVHIFQPSEEDGQGAYDILSEGDWFEQVDNVFGCHIWTNLDSGKISVEAGPRMAAADVFSIEITGSAGHGAQPEQCVDASVVAAATLMNLQTLVSRETAPGDALAITVGRMTSGTQYNVISGSARLDGTTRYFSQDLAGRIESMIDRVVQSTAQLYRATAKLKYQYAVGAVINEEHSSKRAYQAVRKLFGTDAIGLYEKTTTSEDFSEYLKRKPGVFVFLGSRNPAIGADHPHHHDCFDIDESVLKNGAALYAQYAVDFLSEA